MLVAILADLPRMAPSDLGVVVGSHHPDWREWSQVPVDAMALAPSPSQRGLRFCLPLLLIALGLHQGSALAGSGATRVEVLLQGMACSLCSGSIEDRLRALAVAETVKLDLEQRLLSLTLRPGASMPDAQLRSLLRQAGYNVLEIRRLPAVP